MVAAPIPAHADSVPGPGVLAGTATIPEFGTAGNCDAQFASVADVGVDPGVDDAWISLTARDICYDESTDCPAEGTASGIAEATGLLGSSEEIGFNWTRVGTVAVLFSDNGGDDVIGGAAAALFVPISGLPTCQGTSVTAVIAVAGTF